MAVLKTENGQRVELNDNSPLLDGAEQLGVPFGCRVGVCGTCVSEVIGGAENLTELTDNEKALGLEGTSKRCMCQAAIKSGEVVIKW